MTAVVTSSSVSVQCQCPPVPALLAAEDCWRGLTGCEVAAPPPVMSGPSHHPDRTVSSVASMVKHDNLNLYVNVEQDSFYKMIPVSTASQEEVFNLVNYNVTDEIDEGYSTNYSPSSKSTSASFECESSLERPDTSSTEVQVTSSNISLFSHGNSEVCDGPHWRED